MRWFVEFVTRRLEVLNRRMPRGTPEHLLTARRGEMEAYLYLRRHGYRLVATNLRVQQRRGEIDLIGWDDGVLCFIEVKTRSSEGLAPPEAAVDGDKKGHILAVAHRYVRRLPGYHPPPCRFDIVSIMICENGRAPEISLHKGAFSWDDDRPRNYERYREYDHISWSKRR
jgi:putative endonuclease